MTGKPSRKETIEQRRAHMEKTLDELEQIWLKDRPYVATESKLSVADLLAVCELEQPCKLTLSTLFII